MDEKRVDQIIDAHEGKASALIKILLDIQSENHWLPGEALDRVAKRLSLPLGRVQHAATFYKAFSIMPEGQHRVHVCNGTSCHLRGSQKVIDAVEDIAETDESGRKFKVESVTCLGFCSAGPAMEVDGEPHGDITADKAAQVLKKYR